MSANKSDVTEVLRFFVLARHFKFPCAVTEIKQALSLMWSNENIIEDDVLAVFTCAFIDGTDGEEKLAWKFIVNNLFLNLLELPRSVGWPRSMKQFLAYSKMKSFSVSFFSC